MRQSSRALREQAPTALRQRAQIIQAQVARDDRYGDGKGAGHLAGGQRRHERARPLGVGSRTERVTRGALPYTLRYVVTVTRSMLGRTLDILRG